MGERISPTGAATAERATAGQTVDGGMDADRDARARMAVICTRRAVEPALGH